MAKQNDGNGVEKGRGAGAGDEFEELSSMMKNVPLIDSMMMNELMKSFGAQEKSGSRWFGGSREAEMAHHEAMELTFAANEQRDPERRDAMLRQALEINPLCVDAFLMLHDRGRPSHDERRALLENAVAMGELQIGGKKGRQAKSFKNLIGMFWGMIETRPYMRALGALAEELGRFGKTRESVAVDEWMLTLNPNDNQGVRYALLGKQLWLGDAGKARELWDRYADDGMAVWAWGEVLLLRLERKEEEADGALARARAASPGVEKYLVSGKRLPQRGPEFYSRGDESEAIIAAEELKPAWDKHKRERDWLKSTSAFNRRTRRVS